MFQAIWPFAALGSLLCSRSLFHYFQLESYQFPGFFRTLKRNPKRALLPGALMTAVLLALRLLAFGGWDGAADHTGYLLWCAASAVVCLAAGWGIRCMMRDKRAKKPFNVTARVKRLYAVAAVVYLLVFWLLSFVSGGWGVFLAPLALPVWAALAGLCAWPIEKGISELYFRDAQKRLARRPDLIKIGITGSYGKTSVKFILGTLLAEKYQVLVTPSSFNTPMGVTRVIREQLMPSHQVFVAEMGARHVGDIKELCRLVHPRYGVLTSVGPQHLDTFHTIGRIESTKYELMDAIPANGCCFFPDDGAICRELYAKTDKEKRLCGLRKTPETDVWADGIAVTPEGSSFTLHTAEESVACHTRLLGEHNIQNIALAATVALRLGLTLRQIAHGVAKLTPVKHRLELIPSPGVTIIDDAFNSNPRGAEAALVVLKDFPGRRIVITPGMVELGGGEDAFNRAFGEKIAQAADVAILVGRRRTEPIAEGLRSAGFPEEAIHPVSSLDEAAALLRSLGRPGDVALFENDLPDNYSE